MPDSAQYLDIKLLESEYRVVCAPDEKEALLAAVAYVDGKMREITRMSKNAGNTERVAVMAAMEIAHEFLQLKAKPPPQPSFSSPSPENDAQGLDNDSILRKISDMEIKLDAALGLDRLL
ncbi:MAG: cell division protein ZapA [Candidatus Accumulibacter sp.]|jgi:cell division protein ZapA|nr:cell division protein ZapA [Accumulibacter sp.]